MRNASPTNSPPIGGLGRLPLCRPPCRQHVVHDQDPLAPDHGVLMDFEAVGSVFERLVLAVRFDGSLPDCESARSRRPADRRPLHRG